jgi:hypothetical protein
MAWVDDRYIGDGEDLRDARDAGYEGWLRWLPNCRLVVAARTQM